jgi:hypothetical protein
MDILQSRKGNRSFRMPTATWVTAMLSPGSGFYRQRGRWWWWAWVSLPYMIEIKLRACWWWWWRRWWSWSWTTVSFNPSCSLPPEVRTRQPGPLVHPATWSRKSKGRTAEALHGLLIASPLSSHTTHPTIFGMRMQSGTTGNPKIYPSLSSHAVKLSVQC